MNNVGQAIAAMNEYGSKAIPFLFIIDFEGERPLVYRIDELEGKDIFFDIDGHGNGASPGSPPPALYFESRPVPFPRYRDAFEEVQQYLRRGDTYLLNLTFPSEVNLNYSLRQVFDHSRARYRLYYRDQFVVFSPETFVQIREGRIAGFPMKGTISAELPDAAQRVLADEKEFAEHCTIVDLIRNDLSIIATEVEVERFRYIDRVETQGGALLQVSSEITGRVPVDYRARIGELLFRLLPAGSVSGAPKRRTLEIIRAAEGAPRGYYTGVFGCFDGRNLDSAVMIRYLERNGDQFYYRSGGGITALSGLEEEYEELIKKIYVPLTGNDPDRERTPAAPGLSHAAS